VNDRDARGQILPLFALVLLGLMAFSALVVDIGLKYAVERRYQSIADAASLAGAQQLSPATRGDPVTDAMRTAAREQAERVVVGDLIGDPALSPCTTSADIVDCELPGGQFHLSVRTPALACGSACSPQRSIEVSVREPAHPTAFARLFGQTTWDIHRASVAGLEFGKQYAIVTLRPPQPLGSSSGFDVRDFGIAGGTQVHIAKGDVGTNANMIYGGSGSKLYLDAGYSMFYYDPFGGPDWTPPTPPDPEGKKIGAMITDPGYVIPIAPATAGSIAPEGAGSACNTAAATLLASTSYGQFIPRTAPTTPNMASITCLLPGNFTANPIKGSLGGDTTILLTDTLNHGLFYFGDGLTVQTTLIGGYTPDAPGVAVVIPQNKELNVNSNGSGSLPFALSLNAGSKLGNTAGHEATAALDFNGNPIVTTGTRPLKMSLMVTRDPNCTVSTPYPVGCDDSHNDAIKVTGKSVLYLAGVQFMPTDNSSINSSSSTGFVGQVWAWTLKYDGGVSVTQEGSNSTGPGNMRIQTPCSPGEPQTNCD
jgi:hypothetical protein